MYELLVTDITWEKYRMLDGQTVEHDEDPPFPLAFSVELTEGSVSCILSVYEGEETVNSWVKTTVDIRDLFDVLLVVPEIRAACVKPLTYLACARLVQSMWIDDSEYSWRPASFLADVFFLTPGMDDDLLGEDDGRRWDAAGEEINWDDHDGWIVDSDTNSPS